MNIELTREEVLLLDDCIKAFNRTCEEVSKSFNAPELLKATYHQDRVVQANALRHKLWENLHPKTTTKPV